MKLKIRLIIIALITGHVILFGIITLGAYLTFEVGQRDFDKKIYNILGLDEYAEISEGITSTVPVPLSTEEREEIEREALESMPDFEYRSRPQATSPGTTSGYHVPESVPPRGTSESNSVNNIGGIVDLTKDLELSNCTLKLELMEEKEETLLMAIEAYKSKSESGQTKLMWLVVSATIAALMTTIFGFITYGVKVAAQKFINKK